MTGIIMTAAIMLTAFALPHTATTSIAAPSANGHFERWISMQLGVWLDRYPFNNGYLVYME